MSAELDETELAFVSWHATPKGSRNPSNFKDLCSHLGISPATGYRWLKRRNIEAAIDDLVRQAVGGPERVMNVVNAMYEAAIGDARDRVQAATTFLKYAGVLVDKVEKSHSTGSELENMSDEELASEVEKIAIKRAKTVLGGR